MEYIDRKQEIKRKQNLQRDQEHWEEVHNNLIEVQQAKRVQKKSLEISNPGDADEKEADEVARKVSNGESAHIHGTLSSINRKAQQGNGERINRKLVLGGTKEAASLMESELSNLNSHKDLGKILYLLSPYRTGGYDKLQEEYKAVSHDVLNPEMNELDTALSSTLGEDRNQLVQEWLGKGGEENKFLGSTPTKKADFERMADQIHQWKEETDKLAQDKKDAPEENKDKTTSVKAVSLIGMLLPLMQDPESIASLQKVYHKKYKTKDTKDKKDAFLLNDVIAILVGSSGVHYDDLSLVSQLLKPMVSFDFHELVSTLKKKSPTANAIISDLENSPHTHSVFMNASTSETIVDSGYDPLTGAGSKVYLDFTLDLDIDDEKLKAMVIMAHEFAHAWRSDRGLEKKMKNSLPSKPKSSKVETGPKVPSLFDKDVRNPLDKLFEPKKFDTNPEMEDSMYRMNSWAFYKEWSELQKEVEVEASHIENMVRAELDPKQKHMKLREKYEHITQRNFELDKIKNPEGKPTLGETTADVTKDFDYYHENKKDKDNPTQWKSIYEQYGVEPRVQQKSLSVSQSSDPDEKEADEIARKVVSGESTEIQVTGGTINRKGEGTTETTPEFQSKLASTKGGGRSLDDSTRSEMESKMGADFSGVKIHTGGEAHNMSESINAKAFTHGQDVYFKQGEFNANSVGGKELLAHELVHTVQQGSTDHKIRRSKERPHPSKPQVSGTVKTDKEIEGQPAWNLVGASIFNTSSADIGKSKLGWAGNDPHKYSAGQSVTTTLNYNYYLEASDRINRGANTPDYSELQTYFSEWTDNDTKWDDLHQAGEQPRTLYYRVAQYPLPYIAALRTTYNRSGKTFDNEVYNYKKRYLKRQGIPHTVEEADAKNLFVQHEGGLAPKDVNYFNDLNLLIDVAEAYAGTSKNTQFLKEAVAPENTLGLPTLVLESSGSSTVTVNSTTTFSLLDNGAYSGPSSQVTWFALYDTRPESPPPDAFPVVAYPRDATDQNKFTQKFVWKAAGLQYVVCEIKTPTETGTETKRFATQVFVYPDAKIFADAQADANLKEQQNASIPGDLLALDTMVYEERMKYKDRPNLSQYLLAYSEAVHEAIIEQQLVTSMKMKKLKQSNPNTITPFELEQEKFIRLMESYHSDDEQLDDGNQTVQAGPQETKGEKLKAFYTLLQSYMNAHTTTQSLLGSVIIFGASSKNYSGAAKSDYEAPINQALTILKDPLPRFSETTYAIHSSIASAFPRACDLLDGIIMEELAEDSVERKRFENITSFHKRLQDVYENHADAITIPAMFYPDAQQLTRKKDTAAGSTHETDHFEAAGYRVHLTLYKEGDEWVLDDATPESQGKNRIDVDENEIGLPSETRFDELFGQLNYKERFPKGTIYYTVPGGAKDGSDYTNFVNTTADMTLSDWLTTIGLIFAVISLPFTFGGSAMALAVFGISAAISIATMIADMVEMNKHDRWNSQVIALDLLGVVADLAGIAAAAGKIGKVVSTSSKLLQLAGKNYVVLKSAEFIANTTSMVVMEATILNQLSELDAIEDEEQRRYAKMRLMTMAIVVGAAHIVSFRNDYTELTAAMRAGKTIDLFTNVADESIAKVRLTTPELNDRISLIGGQKDVDRFTTISNRTDIDKERLDSVMGMYMDGYQPTKKELGDTLKRLEKSSADEFVAELDSMEKSAVTADVVESVPLVAGVRDAEADKLLGDAVSEMKRNRIETMVALAAGVTLVGVNAMSDEDDGNTVQMSTAGAAGVFAVAAMSKTLLRGIRARRLPLTASMDEVIQFFTNLRTFKQLDTTNKKVRELIEEAWNDAKMVNFSKEEIAEVTRYRTIHPESTLSNGEIAERLRKGEKINAEGYFFDPEAGEIDIKLDTQKVTKNYLAVPTLSETEQVELDLLKKQRDDWMKARDAQPLNTPLYNDYNYRVIKLSERLGEKSADIYMLKQGAKKIYPPPGTESLGAGDLDQVWEKTDGTLIVVEAKGGSSAYGSRKVKNLSDRSVKNKRVQQGTLPYLQDVIEEMKKRGGESKKVADRLSDALEEKKASYIGIRQDFDDNGLLKPIEITDFKIF